MSANISFNPKSTAPCRTVAFSPDNKYLVETNYLGFITIRDVATGEIVNRIMGQTTLAESIRFEPNTNLLYVVGGGFEGYRDFASVMVYEIPSGKRVKEIKGHTDDVIDICFPSKGVLASVSLDGCAIAHNLVDGTKWFWKDYNEYINTCTARPNHDGQFAIAGDSDYTYILSSIEKKVIAEIHTPNDSNGLIWSKDGRYLMVGGDNLDLQYFDSQKNWEKTHSVQFGGSVKKTCYDAMFQDCGLAACYDGQIWSFPLDPTSTKQIYIAVENIEGIWGTNVAASKNLVAVPSFGDISYLFERNEKGVAIKQKGQQPAATFGCNWITINKSENIIASTHDDGKIRFRNIADGNFIKEIKPPTKSLLMGADFHPSLPFVATIDFQGEVFIVDYKTEKVIDSKKFPFGPGISLQFNRNGNFLAVGGYGPDGWVNEISTDGKFISSASLEQPNTGVVKSILFTNDNNIVVGSGDGSVVYHSLVNGTWQVIQHIPSDMELCNAVTFGETSGTIYTGARDQSVRAFDSKTGNAKAKGFCHTRSIKSIHISESEKLIATGSYDRTVIVWDAETLTAVLPPLRISNAGVPSVKFYDNKIYTGSFDGFVCCWTLEGSLVWFKDSINHKNKS